MELKGASDHLYYEFWMLISVARALASRIVSQGWLLNSLLESFVIHFRALLDFFYAEKPQIDDVIASDFFPDEGRWEKIRPPLSEYLSKSLAQAHKEIAHLTYARIDVTPERKKWNHVEIANEIKSIMDLFLANAPKHLFGNRWRGIF